MLDYIHFPLSGCTSNQVSILDSYSFVYVPLHARSSYPFALPVIGARTTVSTACACVRALLDPFWILRLGLRFRSSSVLVLVLLVLLLLLLLLPPWWCRWQHRGVSVPTTVSLQKMSSRIPPVKPKTRTPTILAPRTLGIRATNITSVRRYLY